jgi:hypothetical protein
MKDTDKPTMWIDRADQCPNYSASDLSKNILAEDEDATNALFGPTSANARDSTALHQSLAISGAVKLIIRWE